MKKVFVFPGSGSQRPGMIKLLKSYLSEVQDVFEMASDISHIDVMDLCTTKPKDVLYEAMNTQMSVTAMNLSFLKLLFNRSIEPDIVLGQSLGEFSALAASKAMSFEDVLRLVYARASMICNVKTPSSMYVSLGLKLEQVKEAIAKVPENLGKVEIAVINTDTQIVMGGPVEALNSLAEILKDMGVYKVEQAQVDHGFHTSYMKEMEDEYSAYIDTLKINDPVHRIILNCSAQFGYTAQDIINDIKCQCCHTVLWNDSLKLLYSIGELLIAEVGSGKTITNIIRNTGYRSRIYSMSERKDFDLYLKCCAMQAD